MRFSIVSIVETNMKNKVRKLSVRYKILIPVSILIVLLSVLLGLNAYSRVKGGMIALGIEQAGMAANVALSMIDGDKVATIREGSEDTPEYAEILEQLRKAQKTCGIAFLYTVYEEGHKLYFGVDSDSTANHADPGTEFEYEYSEFEDVFKGEAYVQDFIEETEDGKLLSSYLPIMDSTGAVAGFLGCDFDATYVADRMAAAARSIVQISVILLVISILLLNVIVGGIMAGLKKVDAKLFDIVNNEGDLTQKLDITSGDELELIAGNVNSLLEYIRRIMLNISENSTQLNKSTGNVLGNLNGAKDSISEVSATMQQMSAAMQETSASLTQVNEAVTYIDKTAEEISGKATEESNISKETLKRVAETAKLAQSNRDEAKSQADEMSRSVDERVERSKAVQRISILTEEIINITDQTSLLALNANIEAARAGEAGRGFAVVAGEIGALANNSAKAAEQIKEVSTEVINAVDDLANVAGKMLEFMEEKAMAGYDMLIENSEQYRSDIDSLSGVMDDFAVQSRKLRESIEGIKESVDAVDVAVEESADGVVNVTEVATALAQNMEGINEEAGVNKEIAEELQREVNKFKL